MSVADLEDEAVYLTPAETAAKLRISLRTLDRVRARGEITYVTKGRGARPRVFYTAEAISEYLRRNEPQVVQAKPPADN